MLRIKKMTEAVGKHVYTSDGDYFGQVDDVNLVDNKIDGWKIKLSGGFMDLLGGARGVIIPQQFVKAIGDIFIVNKTSLPMRNEQMDLSVPEPSSNGNEFESF
jgi:sporulation protein YlmC with PRC-barrel domain